MLVRHSSTVTDHGAYESKMSIQIDQNEFEERATSARQKLLACALTSLTTVRVRRFDERQDGDNEGEGAHAASADQQSTVSQLQLRMQTGTVSTAQSSVCRSRL